MKKQTYLLWLFLVSGALFAPAVWGQTTVRNIPFFTILEPADLRSQYQYPDDLSGAYSPASFGANVDIGLVKGLVKLPDIDSMLCTDDGTDFTGKFALIQRGTCEFGIKALNAQRRGAIGVIISNFTDDLILMAPGSVGDSITIPVIMVRNSIGNAMVDALTAGQPVEVVLSSTASLDFVRVAGRILRDDNNNCAGDAGEVPLRNWLVTATGTSGQTISHLTNPDGNYVMWLDTIDAPYQIALQPVSAAWTACPASQTVALVGNDSVEVNFTGRAVSDCVEIFADITAPFLRRCFPNVFTVEVCNQGTIEALGTYADVTLAPEFDPITDVTLPFTEISPDVYRFQLGDLESSECVTFQFQALINCDSTVLNQTLCYSVHAYPDTSCNPVFPLWNGASVRVRAICKGSDVEFQITNVGNNAMSSSQEYVIIEDDVMRQEGTFQLLPGEVKTLTVPANGSTWRLEAGQEIYHPVAGTPAVSIEGCTDSNTFTTGFFTMFPVYDPGFAEDTECQEVIGSFDPNDKQGFPRGVGEDHLIRENTPIDYLIRFQNTGTDTAFTVVVRDTLTASLNAQAIRFGASSHPYTFEKTADNVLVFKFDNIRLVDSFSNEPASHGYLSFQIAQQPDLPYGTLIENSAAIYFDFNPPVITNTTQHEVGKVVGVSLSQEPGRATAPALVAFPNPVARASRIEIKGEGIDNAPWRLFDPAGVLVETGYLEGRLLNLHRTGLATGMHWLEIRAASGAAYFVKLMVAN